MDIASLAAHSHAAPLSTAPIAITPPTQLAGQAMSKDGVTLHSLAETLRRPVDEVRRDLQQDPHWLVYLNHAGYLGPYSPADRGEFMRFDASFNLGSLSTEQRAEPTQELSAVMLSNPEKGLQSLLEVDATVLKGLQEFCATQLGAESGIASRLTHALHSGKTLRLFGAGTSGRIGVQVAAKWAQLCQQHEPLRDNARQVRGIIAGGDSCLIRPQEGFEDSVESGQAVVTEEGISEGDVVIVTSASGSASYNVGVARQAEKCGAHVIYFYNSSENIPERTQSLFREGIASPVCIDIGPPAIAGSTRLQPATLALLCFGTLLEQAAERLAASSLSKPELTPERFDGLQASLTKALPGLAAIATMQSEVLMAPEANLRRTKDETECGYIRLLATDSTFSDTLVDTSETAPTFSTSPPQRQTDGLKKRAEFQAYLAGTDDGDAVWQTLLGRSIRPQDLEATRQFVVGADQAGVGAFDYPPLRPGNVVGAVIRSGDSPEQVQAIRDLLDTARRSDVRTWLMMIQRGDEELPIRDHEFVPPTEQIVVLNAPPAEQDPMGIYASTLTKQALNLISNGTMALCGKLYGNLMADVAISNEKLTNRCMELLRQMSAEIWGPDRIMDRRAAWGFVKEVQRIKAERAALDLATPAPLKMAVAMALGGDTVEEAIQRVERCQHQLDKMLLELRA